MGGRAACRRTTLPLHVHEQLQHKNKRCIFFCSRELWNAVGQPFDGIDEKSLCMSGSSSLVKEKLIQHFNEVLAMENAAVERVASRAEEHP